MKAFAEPGDAAGPTPCAPERLQTSAEEFRSLRPLPGHFSGADWRPAVDAYGGQKHAVMQLLAEQALEHNLTRSCLLTLMGPPDETLDTSTKAGTAMLQQAQWSRPVSKPAGKLLVYHWRGQHDRLVFFSADDQLLSSAWLLSYE